MFEKAIECSETDSLQKSDVSLQSTNEELCNKSHSLIWKYSIRG